MAPARVRTRRRRVPLILVAAFTATVGLAGPAHAGPSIPEIEAQINQEWNTLEPLIEQYNMVHTQLVHNQAEVARMEHQIQPLRVQVDLTMTRVGVVSANLYRYGPLAQFSAMLSSGSPAELADQLAVLDALARGQADLVRGAATLVARYQEQRRPLDQLIAELRGQDAQLAQQKGTIEAHMAELQKLRLQAYGDSGRAGGRLEPVACPVELTTGPGAIAAKTACAQIGKRYVWAAAGPRTFDCSGLTLYAWAAAGVTLRHYTRWQWADTKPVSRANLRPGDLVFYFSDLHHMSMYVGGGWVVHAPTTGDVVRMTRLDNPYLPIAGYRRPA